MLSIHKHASVVQYNTQFTLKHKKFTPISRRCHHNHPSSFNNNNNTNRISTVCNASLQDEQNSIQQTTSTSNTNDVYKAAGQRLQNLLMATGDGEEEFLNQTLKEETVEYRLFASIAACSVILTVTVCVISFLGLDPFGGATFSMSTLRYALLGGLAAVPLVFIKAALWSPAAHEQLEFLEEVQKQQVIEFESLIHNLSPLQCAVILVAEVVPGIFLLLPATTAGIAKTIEMYCSASDVTLPQYVPYAVGVSVTALLTGFKQLADISASSEEYEVVKDAIENSDRFYKTIGLTGNAPVMSHASSAKAASAFRAVALTWLARKQVAARFAAFVSALEVLYLGLLWKHTGDLASPMIAALASSAVDLGNVYNKVVPRKDGSSSSIS